MPIVPDTRLALRAGRALTALTQPRDAHRSPLFHFIPRAIMHDGIVLEQHVREGRFQRGLSAVAAFAGLMGGIEVATQHYRGSFNQPVMYTPVMLNPVLFLAGTGAVFSRGIARTALPLVSLAVLANGLVGFGFHVRGIARKPGGWHIPVFNVVMGPPVFAPLLLGVGGFLGVIASMLRREDDPRHPLLHRLRGRRPPFYGLVPRSLRHRAIRFDQDAREGRLQQVLAGACAASAVLNGVEALYSHYKSAFRQPVQWAPIVLSPLILATSVGAIASPRIARRALPVVSLAAIAVGSVGFFFHARGIVRRPGGTKLPLYNLVYGPPALAPLLYAATGFLGLLASQLRRTK